MTDLQLQLTDEGADLVLERGDVVLDHGLLTPVLVSLFSDARARDEDELAANQDPRGWWGADAAEGGADYGSRLWLLARSKVTEETANQLREHTLDALQWLLDQEIAAGIDVDAARVGGERIDLTVQLRRGDAPRWSALWEGTEETTFEEGFVRVHLGAS
ncbi:MAG: phage GP46 family protein [Planctomycetota bacterium]